MADFLLALHRQSKTKIFAARPPLVYSLWQCPRSFWREFGRWFTSNGNDTQVANGMSKYFSEKAVWFEPNKEIQALDEKKVLFIKGTSQWEMNLRIDSADPNSPKRGKVTVVAWQAGLSHMNEPWEKIEIFPTKPPRYSEASLLQQYLTQDALDSMRPRSSETPEYIDFELVIPDTPEYADH